MKTIVYLVRHCEAIGNYKRICHGITDSQITENGKKQLAQLEKRFKNISIDYAYSSHLNRAKETAKAIIKNKNVEVNIDDRLCEINYGDWENIPWAKFPELYPEQSENWSFHPEKYQAPNGESMSDVYNRIKGCLVDIVNKHPGKTIVIASHGCTVRNALCFLHGLTVQNISNISWCDNTAVTKFIYENGSFNLIYENDSSHLSEELSTIANQNWWKTGAFE